MFKLNVSSEKENEYTIVYDNLTKSYYAKNSNNKKYEISEMCLSVLRNKYLYSRVDNDAHKEIQKRRLSIIKDKSKVNIDLINKYWCSIKPSMKVKGYITSDNKLYIMKYVNN